MRPVQPKGILSKGTCSTPCYRNHLFIGKSWISMGRLRSEVFYLIEGALLGAGLCEASQYIIYAWLFRWEGYHKPPVQQSYLLYISPDDPNWWLITFEVWPLLAFGAGYVSCWFARRYSWIAAIAACLPLLMPTLIMNLPFSEASSADCFAGSACQREYQEFSEGLDRFGLLTRQNGASTPPTYLIGWIGVGFIFLGSRLCKRMLPKPDEKIS